MTEQNRTEQNRTEQNRTEQNRTEQNRTDYTVTSDGQVTFEKNSLEKRHKGQFFTVTNPFNINIFHKWFKSIPDYKNEIICEPFAGSNNLVQMIMDFGYTNQWRCYDIAPPSENVVEEYPVVPNDSISKFPSGHSVVITNPPYLSKNSATRLGLEYPESSHDDLYKVCLDVMLTNSKFVAAIIPESFITQNLFHDRLYAVISLTCKMFEDTDCPVCLALFVPKKLADSDFPIYQNDLFLGNFTALKKHLAILSTEKDSLSCSMGISFNEANGIIGLRAVDDTKGPSIAFVKGSSISSDKIKETSRNVTRISCDEINESNLDLVIEEANKILANLRTQTKDVFFTAFKGLRSDQKYRRRISFMQAKKILIKALEAIKEGD